MAPLFLSVAQAQNGVFDGFTWSTQNGQIAILDYSGTPGAVTVPDAINGQPVKLLTVSSSSGRSRFFSLNIPGNSTMIEPLGFLDCPSLATVTIGNGVTSIGQQAFENCAVLTSVTIGSGVTGIGSNVFSLCTSLTSITVDSQNFFYSSVGGVLFDQGQLTLIQYPEGLTGNYVIPATVTQIANSAFSFGNLKGVTMPTGLTAIGTLAFEACRQLTNFTIPEGVTNIGNDAFDACVKITSVNIPSSVTSIGAGSFANCYNLTSITVDAQSSTFSSVNGVLLDLNQDTLVQYPAGLAGNYIIPDTVTTIAGSAFEGCNLTSVTVPASVTNLGDYAFYVPVKLASIYFRGNAPTADATVFQGNGNVTTVYYGPGTTGWGAAFAGVPTQEFVAPTFSAWQNFWFTPAQLGNTAISGPDAIPAGDGISNLVKYAFNINPFVPVGINGNPSPPAPSISNGGLVLAFNAVQADLTYTVEASADLINWSTDGVTTQVNGTEVTASCPLSTLNPVFMRIVIAPTP